MWFALFYYKLRNKTEPPFSVLWISYEVPKNIYSIENPGNKQTIETFYSGCEKEVFIKEIKNLGSMAVKGSPKTHLNQKYMHL